MREIGDTTSSKTPIVNEGSSFQVAEEGEFVKRLTAEQTPRPPNFERIVELNLGPLTTEATLLVPLLPQRVDGLTKAGAVLIDGRDQREFDAAHVPGSISPYRQLSQATGRRDARSSLCPR
jgi:hypothetical protein